MRLVFFHPRYWVMWILITIWWLFVQLLPWRALLSISRLLALISVNISFSRKEVAKKNIDACFPDYSDEQKQKLLVDHFQMVVMGLFEAGIAWWWPQWRMRNIYHVEGKEHLAEHQGKPVILLAGHFTNLEIGSSIIARYFDIDGMYRKNSNAVYEWLQVMGRTRYWRKSDAKPSRTDFLLEKKNLKKIIRNLKTGRIMWFAPDQDMGAERSVFAPFMTQIAATVTATSKIAKIANALIVPMTQVRTDNGYIVKIYPALENFPVNDDEAAAVVVNQTIESFVKLQPEAYFWVHKRFKTQPNKEPFY